MHPQLIVSIVLIGVMFVGCETPPSDNTAKPSRPSPALFGPPTSESRNQPVANSGAVSTVEDRSVDDPVVRSHPFASTEEMPTVARISFGVFQARVQAGLFSANGKVWNHLDEEAIPAETSRLLRQNGLRVGLGTNDDWPPIRAMLEAEEDVLTSDGRMIVGNGMPFMLDLDKHERDQVVFLYRPGGGLPGATYPASRNYIRVEYAIPLSDPDVVSVDVMPEIRLRPRQAREARTLDEWLDPTADRPVRVFHELAFSMRVGPGEFFAIGPSPASDRPHLLGALLLTEEQNGRRYESMYFVTPTITMSGETVE